MLFNEVLGENENVSFSLKLKHFFGQPILFNPYFFVYLFYIRLYK